MRDLYLTYARRRTVFGAQSFGLRSRFLDEIPPELTDRERRALQALGAARGATSVVGDACVEHRGVGRRRDAAVFGMGDDVIHAAFGEGVVTGVEPGGIVVVRFAEDGSERKLMADYAPIRRR